LALDEVDGPHGRGLLLLEALDLGPQVAALLDGHDGRPRRVGRGRHAGQDLVHQALVVVLLRLAAGGHLAVAVVVRVVAGPARDLGDLAVGQAGDVVVEEQAAPRAIVVDDVAEPQGPVRHGDLQAKARGGREYSAQLKKHRSHLRIRGETVESALPASTHHDYYRLRTEWLRYKSQLYDGLTGLPALPAVMEDVRRIVESQGSADVVYVDLGRSGGQETKLGWAAYDGAVREFAAVLASLQAAGELTPQDVVCLHTVRSVFQPIVRLADRQIIGHEALTRPVGGVSFDSVEELFAFAESTDLIMDFERLCRRTAIETAAKTPGLGLLFINASAQAVEDP